MGYVKGKGAPKLPPLPIFFSNMDFKGEKSPLTYPPPVHTCFEFQKGGAQCFMKCMKMDLMVGSKIGNFSLSCIGFVRFAGINAMTVLNLWMMMLGFVQLIVCIIIVIFGLHYLNGFFCFCGFLVLFCFVVFVGGDGLFSPFLFCRRFLFGGGNRASGGNHHREIGGGTGEERGRKKVSRIRRSSPRAIYVRGLFAPARLSFRTQTCSHFWLPSQNPGPQRGLRSQFLHLCLNPVSSDKLSYVNQQRQKSRHQEASWFFHWPPCTKAFT